MASREAPRPLHHQHGAMRAKDRRSQTGPPLPMSSPFAARVVPSIATIDAAAWDSCANPPGRSFEEAAGERFNPFITHAFLHALEASGSVGGRSGWTPAHLTVEDASGPMGAASACSLKS